MTTLRKIFLQFLILFSVLLAGIGQAMAESENSIAFYYGALPPVNALSQFDRLVLESENIKPAELKQLKQHGSTAFAYLSIGEVGPQRSWKNQVQSEWTAGVNTTWDSQVMDLTSTGWQRFVLQRVDALLQQGYDGLFLDTMDSYQLHAKDPASRTAQQNALANLIYRIKRRNPSIKIISNRGFEVMDKIGSYLDGVAAESLFSRWNNEKQQYVPVPEQDRQWLQARLSEVKRKHNIDVISIDYVSPAEREKAKQVAKDIVALGFTPWVANPSLDYVGISNIEVIPREVLMIYDSVENDKIHSAEVHTFLAAPLEYMGYVPVYHDLAAKGLPQGILKGSYAGIVSWHREAVKLDGYNEWLNKHLDDKIPLAMFSSMGTGLTGNLSEKLGVKSVSGIDSFSLRPISSTNMIGFEAPVPARIDQFAHALEITDNSNTSHLRFSDKRGNEFDAVITGEWGGLAISPVVIDGGFEPIKSWIIDPFEFLKTSLKLTDAPMPDVTTENGRRLWLAHIDGDAMPSWAELPGRFLGSEIIRDNILKRYKLPHTISIVEAELIHSLDRRERMEQTARDIFALDYVEIATHTYSHPFHWQALKPGAPSGTDNLKIPNYFFDLDREIGGSAHYIDNNLAPPGKKTEVLLWSGDAIPLADAISTAHKYGLLNMNGGNTIISKQYPTVSMISPNARIVDGWIQIYAPIMNENVYTNEWLGPFDGFRRAIETFNMTEYPRRMKPVNIYYHFYIGTKKAGLRSLEEVYEWSLQQDLFPVLSSEYIVKVPDFRKAGLARHLDGRWKLSGLGNIKSIRTLAKNSWPDLSSSEDLIGAAKSHDATYIHTNGANSITFRMQSTRPQKTHLVYANAKVNNWKRRADNTIGLNLSGAVPVELDLSGDRTYCDITSNGTTVRGKLTADGNTRFNFPTKDTGDATIDCKT